MADCLIAFGANEGDPLASFQAAVDALRATDGIAVTAVGQPQTTEPVGGPAGQPQYLNAAIRLTTELSPQELHQRLVVLESELGRERRVRWGSRKIDLDLLLYGQQQIETESLTVPHPRMSFRRFVLEPCREIAGDMVHPTSGRTIAQLLVHLDDRPDVVAWVNASPDFLDAFAQQGGSVGWTFMQAANVDQFTEVKTIAKLVVVFEGGNDCEEVAKQAIVFNGPMLDLRTAKEPVAEIIAALAATK